MAVRWLSSSLGLVLLRCLTVSFAPAPRARRLGRNAPGMHGQAPARSAACGLQSSAPAQLCTALHLFTMPVRFTVGFANEAVVPVITAPHRACQALRQLPGCMSSVSAAGRSRSQLTGALALRCRIGPGDLQAVPGAPHVGCSPLRCLGEQAVYASASPSAAQLHHCDIAGAMQVRGHVPWPTVSRP